MTRKSSPFISDPTPFDEAGATLASPDSTPTEREAALRVIKQQVEKYSSALREPLDENGVTKMSDCGGDDDTCCGHGQGAYYC